MKLRLKARDIERLENTSIAMVVGGLVGAEADTATNTCSCSATCNCTDTCTCTATCDCTNTCNCTATCTCCVTDTVLCSDEMCGTVDNAFRTLKRFAPTVNVTLPADVNVPNPLPNEDVVDSDGIRGVDYGNLN